MEDTGVFAVANDEEEEEEEEEDSGTKRAPPPEEEPEEMEPKESGGSLSESRSLERFGRGAKGKKGGKRDAHSAEVSLPLEEDPDALTVGGAGSSLHPFHGGEEPQTLAEHEFKDEFKRLRSRREKLGAKIRSLEKHRHGPSSVQPKRLRKPWTGSGSRWDWDWEKAGHDRSFPTSPDAEQDMAWKREMSERAWKAYQAPAGMVINPRRGLEPLTAEEQFDDAEPGSRLAAFRYQLREDYPQDGLPPCPPVTKSAAAAKSPSSPLAGMRASAVFVFLATLLVLRAH